MSPLHDACFAMQSRCHHFMMRVLRCNQDVTTS
jgi:hypothetical protein